MTEETTPAPTTSSSRKFLLPVIVVILLIGVIGYFASQAGLDKALVKQAVDRFAENLKNSTADTPAPMTFTYDDIRLEGGLADRHAIIVNPALTEEDKRDGNAKGAITYRTEEVALYPKSADLRELQVSLAKPIRVLAGSDATTPKATITQREAITVDITEREKDGQRYIDNIMKLPDAFLIDGDPANAKDPWNQLSVTIAPGATLTRSVIEGGSDWSDLGESTVNISDVKIEPSIKPENTITIATIQSTFRNTLTEKKLNHVTLESTVGPVTGGADILPYGPIEFALDAEFEGALQKTAEAFAQAQSSESSMKVETFKLKAKDAAIYATADFVSGARDILPVGTANVTIENVPFVVGELKTKGGLAGSNEKLLNDLITIISGKPAAEVKDLSIDIKRVHEGSFEIGETTFEEIMALMFKGMLSNKMNPAVTEKPLAAPAEPTPAPVTGPPVDTAPAAVAPAEEKAPAAAPAPKESDTVPDTRG